MKHFIILILASFCCSTSYAQVVNSNDVGVQSKIQFTQKGGPIGVYEHINHDDSFAYLVFKTKQGGEFRIKAPYCDSIQWLDITKVVEGGGGGSSIWPLSNDVILDNANHSLTFDNAPTFLVNYAGNSMLDMDQINGTILASPDQASFFWLTNNQFLVELGGPNQLVIHPDNFQLNNGIYSITADGAGLTFGNGGDSYMQLETDLFIVNLGSSQQIYADNQGVLLQSDDENSFLSVNDNIYTTGRNLGGGTNARLNYYCDGSGPSRIDIAIGDGGFSSTASFYKDFFTLGKSSFGGGNPNGVFQAGQSSLMVDPHNGHLWYKRGTGPTDDWVDLTP